MIRIIIEIYLFYYLYLIVRKLVRREISDGYSLVVFPETACEQHHHAENLQTADEHESGTNPFGSVRQGAPRLGGANLRADGRSYIADAAQRYGNRIEVIDMHADHCHG